MDDAVDAADPRLAGIRPSQIPTRKALQMTGPDGNPLVLFDNISPATPSGKIELKSETLAKRWGAAALLPGWRERDAPHPLMLISPSSDKPIRQSNRVRMKDNVEGAARVVRAQRMLQGVATSLSNVKKMRPH